MTDHTVANEHALDNLSVCVLEKVEAVRAGCIKDGCIEHWKCTICNRFFADEQGLIEINRADTIVPALGGEHEYVITDSKEPSSTENGYRVETCTKCGDVKTTVIAMEQIETPPADISDQENAETSIEEAEQPRILSPLTGDTFNKVWYYLLTFLAASMVIVQKVKRLTACRIQTSKKERW